MGMKIAGLIVAAIFAAIVIGREVIAIGEARRAGHDVVPLYKRFRRRLKSVVLIWVLLALSLFFRNVADAPWFTPKVAILYVGLAIITLFWIMILAARDFKEAAHYAVAANQQITLETLGEIEQRIRERQAGRSSAPPRPPKEDDPQ